MRIRVTTRAKLYEKRKQEHIERGYRIEDERPVPVNGFCSFIAVREVSGSDRLADLVTEALNAKRRAENENLLVAQASTNREEHQVNDVRQTCESGVES